MKELIGPQPLPKASYRTRQLPLASVFLWLLKTGLVIVFVVVLTGISTLAMYRIPAGKPFVRAMSRVVRLPVVSIAEQNVSYKELRFVERAFEAAAVFDGRALDEAALHERAIRHLSERIAMENLLAGYDVSDVSEAEARVYETFGVDLEDLSVDETLLKSTGLLRDEFHEVVIYPLALRAELEALVLQDVVVQSSVRGLVEEVHKTLFSEPSRFLEVTAEYGFQGEGGSGLGLQPIDAYPEAARGELLFLEEGSVSSIIELPDAFAIYYVFDRSRRGEEARVATEEFRVEKRTLDDLLVDRLENIEVTYYTAYQP